MTTLIESLKNASTALPHLRTQEEVQHLRETLLLLLEGTELQQRRIEVLAELGQQMEWVQ